ncbi:peptidase domain-containing ABC transporter [Virgibacillus sp. YIM 98842]|uniref:peptidase domain-containing ABC transporter n=1 Tax=Virgibacillus sp. YIM 98842 TaxID=2663533 RepID=UPI0013DC1E3F|nr:peptidase domain-containing ABC transporter [Virgibacillus sp. YIM 98842]
MRIRKRVPFIGQTSQSNCGAASLAMIFRYYRNKVSFKEILENNSTGRDGLTALTLKKIAEDYNFTCNVYQTKMEDLSDSLCPAILHWDDFHYVVLEKVTGKTFTILDPAKGRKKLSFEEFYKSFSGLIFTFSPPEKNNRVGNSKNNQLLYYIKYIFINPKITITILLLSVVTQLISLAPPILIQIVIDEVIGAEQLHLLNIFIIGMGILFISFLIIASLRTFLGVKLQVLISRKLSHDFINHLFKLPINFFEQRTTGDLTTRMNNINTIREILARSGSSLILDIFMIIGCGAVMYFYAPSLALVMYVIGAIQLILMFISMSRIQKLTRLELEKLSESQSHLNESIRAMMFIKTSGSEESVVNRWSNVFSEQMQVYNNKAQFSGLIGNLLGSISIIAPLIILVTGAYQVVGGNLTIGALTAFITLSNTFLGPIGSVVGSIQSFQYTKGVFERLLDVMESTPEKIGGDSDYNGNYLSKPITLKNLCFSFEPNMPPVIKNVNLTISPGEKVSIVGATGSGKTTLSRLILGLYNPTAGTLKYGNKEIESLNIKELRKNMGIVLQDTMLFNDTIEKNISYFEDLTADQIKKAAKIAMFDFEIEQMPLGYKTIIGENGQSLSGGQRQRLAIARALVREPSLLILDEATSQLDTLTEFKLHENLDDLRITRIVIAHRLATVMDSHKIIVMDNGAIRESGTHEELMARKGMYYELFNKQTETIEHRAVQ